MKHAMPLLPAMALVAAALLSGCDKGPGAPPVPRATPDAMPAPGGGSMNPGGTPTSPGAAPEAPPKP